MSEERKEQTDMFVSDVPGSAEAKGRLQERKEACRK